MFLTIHAHTRAHTLQGTINIQQLNMMLTSLNGPDKLSTDQVTQLIRSIRSDGTQRLSALDMAEAFFPVTDEQRSANKQNENRRRCEKQAILVLDELYTKQAGLVQDMAYVNEKYINTLKMEKGKILSNAEHDLIFRNWGALLQVHKELSDGIKIQAEDKVVGVWLPRIFDEFIKFLPKATDAMREFAKGVTPAEEAMDDLISRGNAASKNFKAFLDLRLKDSGAFRGGNAPRGLSSLMIAPIHSFLRYRLFFTEMLKILKKREYAYITLIRDLEEMSRLSERSNTEINEIVAQAKRRRDNLKRFKLLQKNKYNPSMEMISVDRQFLFMLKADIKVGVQSSKGDQIGVYCYSDMLIVVLKDAIKYQTYRDILTRKMGRNGCHLLVLVHTGKKSKLLTYELSFRDADDNRDFLDHCVKQRQAYFKDHHCFSFWCVHQSRH